MKRSSRFLPHGLGAVAMAAMLPLPSARAAAVSASVGPADWLLWTPSAHTVTLTLIAGYNSARHGFNFNGYSTGTMIISVPRGTLVHVIFHNHAQFPHSALIADVNAHERTSAQGFPLAFPGAYTPQPLRGVQPRQTRKFSFVAGRIGRYELVCGVARHAQTGMWDVFQVTAGGLPSLTIPS